MKENGLIIVFTGDGKGKTSAAIGCTIRMLGWQKKVIFCTFFKKSNSGEFRILKKLKGLKLLMFCCKHPSFSTDIDREEFKNHFYFEWKRFLKKISTIKKCDLLVLDEILIAVRDKLINDKEVVIFIDEITVKIPEINIILTGRGATDNILEKADMVSEICCKKHPYPEIKAKKGIDW